MSTISESEIEDLALNLLERQGFERLFGPDIAPDGTNPLRSSYEEVLLTEKLRNAIDRINPDIPEEAREEAFWKVAHSLQSSH